MGGPDNPPPFEWNEFQLARTLDWTLNELRAHSLSDVCNIVEMLDVEAQLRQARARAKTQGATP